MCAHSREPSLRLRRVLYCASALPRRAVCSCAHVLCFSSTVQCCDVRALCCPPPAAAARPLAVHMHILGSARRCSALCTRGTRALDFCTHLFTAALTSSGEGSRRRGADRTRSRRHVIHYGRDSMSVRVRVAVAVAVAGARFSRQSAGRPNGWIWIDRFPEAVRAMPRGALDDSTRRSRARALSSIRFTSCKGQTRTRTNMAAAAASARASGFVNISPSRLHFSSLLYSSLHFYFEREERRGEARTSCLLFCCCCRRVVSPLEKSSIV